MPDRTVLYTKKTRKHFLNFFVFTFVTFLYLEFGVKANE